MNKPLDIDVSAVIGQLARQLQPLMHTQPAPVIVGIHTGGAWVAQQLHQALAAPTSLCTLNISFYRDDFTQRGLHPHVGPSQIDEEIDNRHLILVDDVLQSGRTVRAAMNELFDYGRPASIRLVALVDRGNRKLPIAADYVGVCLSDIDEDRQIKMTGPEPLTLVLK